MAAFLAGNVALREAGGADAEATEFAQVLERFVAACAEMAADGWWWAAPELTAKAIRRGVLREMLARKF